ncbi:MAG: glycosyltransferase [Acidobacteria bacterium]|nr:glycosyltransferase [Acidobacteriota bacterium]
MTHIITGLNLGGAEMMLYKVLLQMNRDAFQAEVISLREMGALGEKIAKLGIPVRTLNMRPGVPDPRALWRLVRILKRQSPDLIQSWMYHANLMGGIAAKLAGNIPIVWGIHHSNFDPKKSKRQTVWTMKAGALLSSRVPREIICCGEVPKRVHIEMGYDAKKTVAIPNGFDLTKFHPDPQARTSVRQELNIPVNAPLVGLIARYHPKKDHHTFVQAAELLHRTQPDVFFLLCGTDISAANKELVAWIRAAGIEDRCRLLGIREDMPRITAALDVATSVSSYGEGFPIVMGEAMACGVPCVVTDVGDSAHLVGTTGLVVPPQDPLKLSQAWRCLLQLDRETKSRLGRDARHRIADNFSLPIIVSRYEQVYHRVAGVFV